MKPAPTLIDGLYRDTFAKYMDGMVRGHWRRDWRHPGERIWISEHQRGDASLGFVTHDYTVEGTQS